MGLNDTLNCAIDGGVTTADSTSSINKSVVVSVEEPKLGTGPNLNDCTMADRSSTLTITNK